MEFSTKKYGGYPALVSDEMTEDDRFIWLKNYANTYLERDIRDLASFRDLEPFINFNAPLLLIQEVYSMHRTSRATSE